MGLKNGRKTDEKELAKKAERETKMDLKLDEISNDVKEVKETVKSIQNDVKDHEGRIAKLCNIGGCLGFMRLHYAKARWQNGIRR